MVMFSTWDGGFPALSVGPKCNHVDLYKKEAEGDLTQTEGRRRCDRGGGERRDAATRQGEEEPLPSAPMSAVRSHVCGDLWPGAAAMGQQDRGKQMPLPVSQGPYLPGRHRGERELERRVLDTRGPATAPSTGHAGPHLPGGLLSFRIWYFIISAAEKKLPRIQNWESCWWF